MSTDLKAEIEQAADAVVETMVVDAKALGSSIEDKDVAASDTDVGQSDKESADEGSGDTADSEAVTSSPDDEKSDTDGQQGKEEDEEESSDAVQGDGEKEKADAGISQTSLARAFEVGVGLEEARTFKDDRDLNEFVDMVERDLRTRATAQAQAEVDGEATKQAKDEDPFKDLKLDPEKYDDDVVELFGKMKSVLEKQQEQLNDVRQQQVHTANSSEEAMKREVTQWFDGQVTGLGDEFVDSLGKGDIGALTPGSPQLAKREEIANQMAVQMAGYHAMGSLMPPREKVFADAAQVVLGSEFGKLQERKLQKKLEDRKGKHISRAGGRSEKTKLSPEEEVARMLNEKFDTGQ